MKCRNCGTELETDALFCDECGCKVERIEETIKERTDDKTEKVASSLKEEMEPQDNKKNNDIWHTIGNLISGAVGLYALYIIFKIFTGSYDANPVPAIITLLVVGIFGWLEDKLPSVHPLVFSVIEIVCLVFALNAGSSIQAVEIVKMSAPEMHPKYNYGEIFDYYFEDPEWKYIEKRNNGEYVVEFYGRFEYLGSPETATIQFSVYIDEDDIAYTELERIIIDDEEVDDIILTAIMLDVFDEYQNYIDGIESAKVIESPLTESNEENAHEIASNGSDNSSSITETVNVDETTYCISDTEQQLDYGYIYGGIADMYYSDYAVYALHDMDNDGYKEFLMQTGNSSADTRYVVYTTDGSSIMELGEIQGNVSLYAHESGQGIYTDFCNMGYEEVKHVYIKDMKLCEEEVFADYVEEYGYVNNVRMEELNYSITMYSITEGPLLGNNYSETDINNQFIFPDSASRYLTDSEIRSIPKEMLKVGRNEIFARHGYIFNSEELQNYFESTSWYYGTVLGSDFDMEAVFNEYEKKNVELIQQIENE